MWRHKGAEGGAIGAPIGVILKPRRRWNPLAAPTILLYAAPPDHGARAGPPVEGY